MTIRLVIFDLTGATIQDGGAMVQRTMRDAVGRAGLALRDGAMNGVLGMAAPLAIRTIIEGHGRDELLPRVDQIHTDFASQMTRHFRTDPGVRAIDGVAATFGTLRAAGVQVALNTGLSRLILDEVLRRFDWLGTADVVDTTISADEVSRGRPYPDMIDAVRARLGGVPYAQVAKVGDTPIDLQEGAMARCGLVVGILTSPQHRDALAEHPHDQLIGSVAEMPDLLSRLGMMPA